MTFEEAKKVFINRGFIEVDGGTIFDGDKWREACYVISQWLEQESCDDWCDDWCDVPSDEMTLEQARRAVKFLRKKLVEHLEQESCEDEYIKVPKKALMYRTAGMVAYNVEWLRNHFDIERAVICGVQGPALKTVTNKEEAEAYPISKNIINGFEEFTKKMFQKGQPESNGYEVKVINRGNCIMCGKELTEGLFLCKECEAKAIKGIVRK